MPVYPGALTAIGENKADGTATATDHAAHHNQLADELNAVTAELGTDPSGSFIDVKSRLNARLTCRKTADQTNATTTAVNATDLTLPIDTIGLDYYFKFFLVYYTNTAGVTAHISVLAPAVAGAGAGYIGYLAEGTTQTALQTVGTDMVATVVLNGSNSYFAPTGGTSIPAANTPVITRFEGILSNPSATGTLQVSFRLETSTTGTITMKRGSWGELYIA